MVDSRFLPRSGDNGPVPLFLDTNVIVAQQYVRAARHDEVREVLDAIGHNQLPYYPLLTNQYVIDEVISLLLSHAGIRVAQQAVDRTLETDTIRVLDVEPSLVDRAIERFRDYDDQALSLTDHVIAIQASDLGIDHVFSYDSGFRTLGCTVLPRTVE